MKTKAKIKSNQWVLKNKETGKQYSNYSYPSRTAARQAAKGRRFKGMYTPVKSVDIDPKKLKKGKPAPTPKSEVKEDINGIRSFKQFMDWLFEEDLAESVTAPVQYKSKVLNDEGFTMKKTTTNSTKPKLRKSTTALGSKFHRHGTFGVK